MGLYEEYTAYEAKFDIHILKCNYNEASILLDNLYKLYDQIKLIQVHEEKMAKYISMRKRLESLKYKMTHNELFDMPDMEDHKNDEKELLIKLNRCTTLLDDAQNLTAETKLIGQTILSNLDDQHNHIVEMTRKTININPKLDKSNNTINRIIIRCKKHWFISLMVIFISICILCLLVFLIITKK